MPIASDARSPHAYISSSSARSRSAVGRGALRLLQQLRDLAAVQHLAAAGGRGAGR